ncbi:MFS transporter, partial [Streptomyces sp. NPDC055078]
MPSTNAATKPRADRARGARPDRRAWGVVILLFVFYTLNFADKAAIGIAAGPIREDLGLSAGQFGLASSAFFWLFALGAVSFTVALRWISFKWAAAFLMVTWVVSMAPLTMPTTFGVLLVSRIVLGLFEGPTHALCQSIVADRFPPEKRAFAGAVVNTGSSVGPLICAPALTWLIVTYSWHAAFIALIAAGLLWLVVWLLCIERQPLRKQPTLDDATDTDPNGHIDVPFTTLLKLRSFWGLAMLSFAGYLITSLKISWLPAYLNEGLGYATTTVGTLITVPYICAIAVLLGSGAVSGRL